MNRKKSGILSIGQIGKTDYQLIGQTLIWSIEDSNFCLLEIKRLWIIFLVSVTFVSK